MATIICGTKRVSSIRRFNNWKRSWARCDISQSRWRFLKSCRCRNDKRTLPGSPSPQEVLLAILAGGMWLSTRSRGEAPQHEVKVTPPAPG